MHDEGRRRVGPDAQERRRVPEHLGRLRELPLHDPAFEELAQAVVSPHAARPVEDAVEGDHCPDRRVDVFEPGLELRVVRGQSHERSQMTAGRATRDNDEVGIAAVLRDVGADPCQRAFAVDQVVGPGRARREAIVDRDADPAPRREVVHQRQPLLIFAAHDPRAAVNL